MKIENKNLMGGGLKSQKLFEEIISLKNLCLAWNEFKKGKTKKADVIEFASQLDNNIINLHKELIIKTYHHASYSPFYIQDPKLRHIHKATVKDRVLHHAIFRILYPIFDPTFIYDSYSCRLKKGTHRAINRLREFAGKASKNNTKTCWVWGIKQNYNHFSGVNSDKLQGARKRYDALR